MALCLAKLDLSEKIIETARKHCILESNRFDFLRRQYVSSSISFFLEDEKRLILPLEYGKKLLFSFSKPIPKSSFEKSVSFSFRGTILKNQKPIVEDAISTLKDSGIILQLYTGIGKTVICAYLSAYRKKKTVILISSLTLASQWKNTFCEFTDAKVVIIELPFEMNSEIEEADVIICMDTRVSKLPVSLRLSIGTMIIDEAHLFCTPSRVTPLLSFLPSRVIASTATFLRENDSFSTMINLLCGTKVLYQKSTKPFSVIKYETNIFLPEKIDFRTKKINWTKYVSEQLNSEFRNSLILSTVMMNLGYKILILTWRVEHVYFLSEQLEKRGISVDNMVSSKKKYSDSNVLIGTISKIGTGFDEKTLCENFNGIRINLLLLVSTMKSMTLLEQVAGRCFRSEFPNIIYFIDSNEISQRHWKKAEKWFVSRNGKILSNSEKQTNEKILSSQLNLLKK
jgi:superfamily II DNA or RNA helicase